MDIFIPRGAWFPHPDPAQRCCATTATARSPTSPRRRGCSTRSIPTPPRWADYDNDGWLDLFVGCEQQPNRLYHNRGTARSRRSPPRPACRQTPNASARDATWIDYDNDDYPDLFVNNLTGDARLFPQQSRRHLHRRHRRRWASTGPTTGFSCWAWDYDNDGWLDIFATCYDRIARRRGQGPARPAARPALEPALPQPRAARASRT